MISTLPPNMHVMDTFAADRKALALHCTRKAMRSTVTVMLWIGWHTLVDMDTIRKQTDITPTHLHMT